MYNFLPLQYMQRLDNGYLILTRFPTGHVHFFDNNSKKYIFSVLHPLLLYSGAVNYIIIEQNVKYVSEHAIAQS